MSTVGAQLWLRAQLIAENMHRVARGEPPLHLIPAE